MPSLLVGSFEAKRGIKYSGVVPQGNAIRLTEKVKISINNTPLAYMPRHEDIFTLPNFSYVMDRDTVILLTRIVNDDLSIIFDSKCPTTVALVKNAESAIICSVIVLEATATGTVTCQANIFNDNGQDKNVIIKAYNGTTEIGTTTNQIEKRSEMQSVLHFEITSAIAKDDVISFKVEAKGNNMTIEGGNHASIVQVLRRT